MNPKKFKAMLILHGETYETLAFKLGCSAGTLSAKVNNTGKLTRNDIAKIAKAWGLTAADTIAVFFGDIFPDV